MSCDTPKSSINLNTSKPSEVDFLKLVSFHLRAVLYLYKDCKSLENCRDAILKSPQNVNTVCLSEDLIRIKYGQLDKSLYDTEGKMFEAYAIVAKTLKEIETFNDEERSPHEMLLDLVHEIMQMQRKAYYLRELTE